MNLDSLTERSKGFLQAAQTIALRDNHQQVTPFHLLKALLDDSEGQAGRLIDSSGGDAKRALGLADKALAKLPKVEGSNSQMYFSQDLAKIVDQAGQLSTKAGDSFVTAEYLLLALAFDPSSETGKVLADAGVTIKGLNAAINDLRKGRTADSACAEDQYEALKKYTRDLTEAATNGKLDPVIGRDEEIRRTI